MFFWGYTNLSKSKDLHCNFTVRGSVEDMISVPLKVAMALAVSVHRVRTFNTTLIQQSSDILREYHVLVETLDIRHLY